MSLVAYGDSDCDSEDDDVVSDIVKKPSTDCVQSDYKVVGGRPILKLPQPKSIGNVKIPDDSDLIIEDKLETLPKKHFVNGNNMKETKAECPLFPSLPKPKAGGKVKIFIPSLNEFYDDEDSDYQPKKKMIKPSNSGCGLFSMLPDPKNKKTSKASTTISMVPRATLHKMSNVKENHKSTTADIRCFEPKPTELEDDVDVDDQEDVDFLGLNKIGEVPDVAPVAGFELPELKTDTSIIEDDKIYGPVYCPESGTSDIYEDDETKLTLDANALKQLGDRDKTHIKQVDVINVNMSQVMEESQQWLQKNLSEEYAESKNVGSDINVTGQSKRKHQITYLAQQAKANELKLKNMWAENRLTRKQTQAKYGF